MKKSNWKIGRVYESEFKCFKGKLVKIENGNVRFEEIYNSGHYAKSSDGLVGFIDCYDLFRRFKLEKEPFLKKISKFFLPALLLIAFSANAQRYSTKWSEDDAPKYAFVSVSFDAKHAIVGSNQTQNKPSLDAIIQLGANCHGWEVAIEYEDHSALKPKFQRYAVLVGYSFDLDQGFSVYNGISYGSIIRENNANFFSVGYNGELRYDLGEKVILGARLNVQQRLDIEFYCPNCKGREFVASGFISLYFKLN